MWFTFAMVNDRTRRNFLRTAPLAAAVAWSATDTLALAADGGQSAGSAAPQPFQIFTAEKLADAMKALDAKPGDNRLYESKAIPVQIILTTEKHKSAAEFEWHEGRDHVLQVIDGSTAYEIGGTPTGTKAMGPGEWHATGSEGSKTITLNKGDMLLIPRGTLHKRSTADSVTFMLISNPAPAKA